MSTLKHKKAGDLGFDYFSSLFEGFEQYSFLKATFEQDFTQGIDGFIINASDQTKVANIDVKNTKDIYFLNLYSSSKQLIVRHPLKKNSLTTHVAVVSCSNFGNKFYGFKTMDEWLGQYIKPNAIQAFKDELADLDTQFYPNVIGATQSLSQACYKIKLSLLPYLKDNCFISYEEVTDGDVQISFKLYTSDKSLKETFLTEEMITNINTPSVNEPESDIKKFKPHEKHHSITI